MSKKKSQSEPAEIKEQFRLSQEEFFILHRIYNDRAIGVVMAPPIEREFWNAWKLGDEYEYREDCLDAPVAIGAIVQVMPI